MKAIPYRTGAVLAACLILLLLSALTAEATVLKNKQTGETIKGTLTGQQINNMVVFKLDGGGNKFIRPGEWEEVEGAEPTPTEQTTDDDGDPEVTKPDTTKRKQRARAYLIPSRARS